MMVYVLNPFWGRPLDGRKRERRSRPMPLRMSGNSLVSSTWGDLVGYIATKKINILCWFFYNLMITRAQDDALTSKLPFVVCPKFFWFQDLKFCLTNPELTPTPDQSAQRDVSLPSRRLKSLGFALCTLPLPPYLGAILKGRQLIFSGF